VRKHIGIHAYFTHAERDWLREMGERAHALYKNVVAVPSKLYSLSRVIRACVRVAMRHPDEVLEEIRADAARSGVAEDDE
jgi:hypothetical protein